MPRLSVTLVETGAASLTALERLGLTPEELIAVKQQGFVSPERRGRSVIYKLRFRLDRRQRVRYLGTNPIAADAVRDELEQLRRVNRLDRTLRKLNVETNRLLRDTKRRLEPVVARAGLKFHGHALRKPHRRSLQPSQSFNNP